MEEPDKSLVLDASTCQGIMEAFLDSRIEGASDYDFARFPTFLRVTEDKGLLMPPTFVDLSRRLSHQLGRVPVVSFEAHCESTHALQGAEACISSCASTLHTLRLYIGSQVSFAATLSLLWALTGRLPKLQILELDAELEHLRPGQKVHFALEVQDLCRSVGMLKTLRVKLDIVDGGQAGFFEALSQIPGLEELNVFSTTQAEDKIVQVSSVEASTADTRFRRLKTLKLSAHPLRCIKMFRNLTARVSELQLEIPELENDSRLMQVLAAAASAALSTGGSIPSASFRPSEASIDALFMPQGIPRPVQSASLTVVSINVLRSMSTSQSLVFLTPLLAARGMCTFTVQHPHPLIYTSQNLLDLFQAWPRIQNLSLNPRAATLHDSLDSLDFPSLEILACVARSAPCLETFGALLSSTSPHSDPLATTIPVYTWAPHVRLLDLGRSLGPADALASKSSRHCALVATRRYIDSLFPGVELITRDCSSWVERLANVKIDPQD